MQVADFHRHLDTCPACLELASILGCLQEGPVAQSVDNRSWPPVKSNANWQRQRSVLAAAPMMLTLTQGVMLASHVYSSIRLVPILWLAFRDDVTTNSGPLGSWPVHSVWMPYVLVCGCVGPMVAGVSLFAALTRRRWARGAARSYALFCMPTLFLAPLALCLLLAARRPRIHGKDRAEAVP